MNTAGHPARTAGTPIACRVDLPDPWPARSRYALEALLLPLGLVPDFAGGDAPMGIFHAPRERRAPDGWLHVVFGGDAGASITETTPWDGEPWPRLYPGGWRQADGSDAGDVLLGAWHLLSGEDEARFGARDVYGRIRSEDALPVRLDAAERPVVDAYREMLGAALRDRGVHIARRRWGGRPWCLCPTHDIDYVRKWRPGIIYREVVENLLLGRRGVPLPDRLGRARRSAAALFTPGDPFAAAIDRIPREVAERGGRATFFLKAGAHGPHDSAYRLESRSMGRRIDALQAAGHEIGLHPSFFAFGHPGYLAQERARLEAVTGRAPRSVRTHYLRFDPLTTPGLLADAGFGIDSTVGFADRPGFRRGTCLPFPLWDRSANAPLGVWELPLAVMESALFNRLGEDADRAVAHTRDVMTTVRRFGGVMVGLWHNTLWDEEDFPGWGRHFTETLDGAVDGGASVATLSDALAQWLP